MIRTPTFAAFCAAAFAIPSTSALAAWNDPQVETIEVGIDRLVSDEALPLHFLAGLGPQHAGRALQSIKVEIDPAGSWGSVQLVVDGQVIQTVATTGLQAVYLVPAAGDSVLGAEVQTVEVRTLGTVGIDDIELNLGQAAGLPQPEPAPQTACAPLEYPLEADVQFTRLDIGGLFDLAAYSGCRVESITMVGRSATGNGRVTARVDGWQAADWTQISAFPGQYTLPLWSDPVIGADMPEIALSFLGMFNVQTVRLNLVDA